MRAAAFVLLPVLAFAGVTPAADRDVEISPPATLATRVGDSLDIELPSGDVRIEPSEDGQLHAAVRFFCEAESARCAEGAAVARIEHQRDGARSMLRFEPESAYSTTHASLEVAISVPTVARLDIRMKAGRLEVDSPTGCLTVRAGAGQVLVVAPAASVATATLGTDLGDATLRVPRGNVRSSRPLLVGADVRWDDGPGSCDFRVELGTGEIKAQLE